MGKVSCEHWRDVGCRDGGECAVGYHRRPSFGTCRACLAGGRLRPPEPIPADFDPEAERRRLKQGGCCGRPSE